MGYEAINFGKKFELFDELWQPKVIAVYTQSRKLLLGDD